MTATKTCAICGKPVPPRPENRSYPFCSDRCRLIDLSKWLGEEYRIPGPRAGDGADQPPAPGAEEDEPS
ncbi:DNA gyrase inhibitor YacG [Anaeromyxobacter diazotrophicus]|uniref:DNA gyrase inhibitor YacG n=1 Tax=Anaeromyxobacter diazotrophicus TaxID=2590199 RepID=A0A7I9VMM9_9BACT|nr:DNA gyrase inhibitor YacG [Anaeromyxobacter diazotrophicus]GEJ57390.1 DNA gyrase inhibitor YacG [Anaeromyxobacter diazotrophicus]